jgi:DHA1 family inner membrane transport protein
VWGVSATVGNLGAGHLADRFGSHRIALIAIGLVIVDFVFLHWSSAHLATAVIALIVWGIAGWGLLVAQQHRLVTTVPHAAPLVIALNSSSTYVAVSASGAIGAAVISSAGAPWLGAAGVVFLLAALGTAIPSFRRAPEPIEQDPEPLTVRG